MVELIYPDGHRVRFRGTDRYDVFDDVVNIYIKDRLAATVYGMPGLAIICDGEVTAE